MAQPDILTVPFGENADSGTIKEIPIVKGPTDPEQQATWSKGFPEITMRPILSGGIPPRGPDFNGVLHAISEHTVYQNGGGKYKWSQEWVDAHGGYEKGATLQDDAGEYEYVSTINNNTINFNTTPSAIGNQWMRASVTPNDIEVKPGFIDPPAGFDQVPNVGEENGEGALNAQAVALAARSKLLKENFDRLADTSDPDNGAAMIGFKRTGLGAVKRTTGDVLDELPISTDDYTTLAGAISAALEQSNIVSLRQNTVVRVPSDCPTLQDALNTLHPAHTKVRISLLIEAGHRPSTGVHVESGDYGNFTIDSEPQPTAFIGLGVDASTLTAGETITQPSSGAAGVLVTQGGFGSRLLTLDSVVGSFDTSGPLVGSVSGAISDSTPLGVYAGPVLVPILGGHWMVGDDAVMPTLGCLIASSGDASGIRNGYRAQNGARGWVLPGAGVVGAYTDGLRAYLGGAHVTADNTIWAFCATGFQASAVTAWNGTISIEGADARFSFYYGVQSGRGALVSAQNADASNAARYGFRGSDAGVMHCGGGRADNCGRHGVYSFNGSVVNAEPFTALNCGEFGAHTSGGILNCGGLVASGGTAGAGSSMGGVITIYDGSTASIIQGIQASSAGKLAIFGGNVRRAEGVDSPTDIEVFSGGEVCIYNTVGGTSIPKNFLSARGVIRDSSITDYVSVTLGSSQDNLSSTAHRSSVYLSTGTSNISIRGLVGGVVGRVVKIFNTSAGSNTITFIDNSTASDPDNKINLSGPNLVLTPGGCATFEYFNNVWNLSSVRNPS